MRFACEACGKAFDESENALSCCDEGVVEVSHCCDAPIDSALRYDWYADGNYQVDICSACEDIIEG